MSAEVSSHLLFAVSRLADRRLDNFCWATTSTATPPSESLLAACSQPLDPQIHQEFNSLPDAVPLALPSDEIYAFSNTPSDLNLEDQDAREDVVNSTLDRALGFAATQQSICDFICRGEHGMNAVHKYIIQDLHIDAGLFEGKVERLIEAIVSL